jgi:hypothetical protein
MAIESTLFEALTTKGWILIRSRVGRCGVHVRVPSGAGSSTTRLISLSVPPEVLIIVSFRYVPTKFPSWIVIRLAHTVPQPIICWRSWSWVFSVGEKTSTGPQCFLTYLGRILSTITPETLRTPPWISAGGRVPQLLSAVMVLGYLIRQGR